MKRLLALVLGGLGLRAFLKRRAKPAPAAAPSPEAADLRAKLAEARTSEPESQPGAEPDVESRRADVHERARQAIDELKN